jgi:hypothetical protein
MPGPVWNPDDIMRRNAEEFHPPAGSRKRIMPYFWGGIEVGAAGLLTRTWTPREQRTLVYNFDPGFPVTSHYDVASTVPSDSPYFKRWGQLDVGALAYEITHTFRKLRSSVFKVRISVLGWYTDENGDEWEARYVVRSTAAFPMWVKCSDEMRMAFYSPDTFAGSRHTDPPWEPGVPKRFVKRGRRSRRRAPRVRRGYDEPPDLFWLCVYGVWYGMEKVIEQLQDMGGKKYLERRSRIFFNIEELVIIQDEVYYE